MTYYLFSFLFPNKVMDRPAVIQNDKFHVSHDTILANVFSHYRGFLCYCRYLTQ